jgi:hypothetical protein
MKAYNIKSSSLFRLKRVKLYVNLLSFVDLQAMNHRTSLEGKFDKKGNKMGQQMGRCRFKYTEQGVPVVSHSARHQAQLCKEVAGSRLCILMAI